MPGRRSGRGRRGLEAHLYRLVEQLSPAWASLGGGDGKSPLLVELVAVGGLHGGEITQAPWPWKDRPTVTSSDQPEPSGTGPSLSATLRRRLGDLDDATLVARAQDGDFAAEDAVQEALVSAWRQLAGFRADAAFSSWLYRIVTNRCLNMARARHLAVPADSLEATLPAAETHSPEAEATVDAERDALDDALERLPVDQRACWVLRESDGLGYDEIAAIVGATPDAVRGRIHRARRSLAATMGEWR